MPKPLAYTQDVLIMSVTQSMIAKEVYDALAKPVILQVDPLFTTLVHQLNAQLSTVFGTQKHRTMLSYDMCTQTMEACFHNLLDVDATVLVLINGVHGQRICDLATRLGYDVDTVIIPWGEPILPENVKATLQRKKYDLVAVVHAESSTGVVSPLTELGHMVHQSGALFMVDCSASLGAVPVAMDDWQVDVGISTSHRCLSCPAGLTLLSFSEVAVERLEKQSGQLLHFQQNLYAFLQRWYAPESTTLMTLPVNLVYALHESLNRLLTEGLQNVFLRHRTVQKQLVDDMATLGFRCNVSSAWRLPMVTVFHMPEGVSAVTVRKALLHEYGIDIRDSLGDSTHLLRVGHMGHTARSSNIARFVAAMSEIVAGGRGPL